MKKEKQALYDTLWKVLSYGMQYAGAFFGVSAIASNLALYIYSQRFFTKETDITEIIKGPYTGTALLGGLVFITGSLIKDYIRKQETSANNNQLEGLINSRLDSYKNQISRRLEDHQAYLVAYTKALEKVVEDLEKNKEEVRPLQY